LLSYPVESQQPGSPYEVSFTVDCALPYAEDLTQSTIALDSTGVTVTNYGNRPTYPVWKLNGPFTQQSLTNMTTGDVFYYDENFPGAPNIGAGEYIEIDTFRNTAYKNGSGANCKPGIDMELSEFFSVAPGSHTLVLSSPGSTGTALWNNAWA
jgi:phage-related protein